MKKVIKTISIIILIVIFLYAFSASYKSHNIDNLAYVIAMGIDWTDTDTNKIKVSFQFTEASAFSSDNSSDSSEPLINSVEAQSIDSAINLMNAYIGKELNLAHCKIVVFSEAVAKNGLDSYVYSLINNSQLRPTSNLIISKCEAKDYIENSSSNFESSITKYYEIFPNSSNYTGYTSNVTIGEFFNDISSDASGSIAILGGKNSDSDDKKDTDDTASDKNDADVIANSSTITGQRGTENIGLAVFRGGTLVGELNALESLCHCIIANEVDTFFVSIPDPEKPDKNLDLSVSCFKKPNITVDVSNSSPYIKLETNLQAKILSINIDENYFNEDYLNKVSSAASKYLQDCMLDYLYKTSTEFNTCIDNIDKYAISKFLTLGDWKNYNWNDNFKSSVFDVNANIKVTSSLLLTES